MSFQTLNDEFFRYLTTEKQLSVNTIQNYQRVLKHFVSFANDIAISSWCAITSHHIRQYVAVLHNNGLSAKSIAQKLSALRSFYNYLARCKIVKVNPVQDIRGPKIAKRLPKTMDVDEISALLNHFPKDSFIGLRDLAILELFYSSGIRLSELQQLIISDFDLDNSTVRVTGKGGKERVVPVGIKAQQALVQWLKVRTSIISSDENVLFITEKGNQLKHRSIQARLEYWGKRLGLNSRLHPHKLRHSCATHFLESASDLRAVQELLGHANLSTTQVYTHLDFQHLAKVYDAAHPRARKKD